MSGSSPTRLPTPSHAFPRLPTAAQATWLAASYSPSPSPDNTHDAHESFDGMRIEEIAPRPSTAPDQSERSSAEGLVAAPDWTQRLSTRGKLARVLIVALAVLVALFALLPRSTFTLPPGIARLLTPAPTQTPLPGAFTSGSWEPVPGPPIPVGSYYALTASPTDPATAYACMVLASADATGVMISPSVALWLTHDAGQTWREATLPRSGVSTAWSPRRAMARSG